MSIRVMTQVWDSTEAKGTDRLVLLAIADSADDDGSNAWPSMARLAHKAQVAERTVQRSIRSLEAMGLLAIEDNAGGTANTRSDRRPNRYTVLVPGCQSVTPKEPRGDTQRANGVTPSASRGDGRVVRTVLDPSIHPSNDAIQRARERYPQLDIPTEVEQFRNYHLSRATKMARWDAAFATWLGNAVRWQTGRSETRVGRSPRSVGDRNLITAFGGIR